MDQHVIDLVQTVFLALLSFFTARQKGPKKCNFIQNTIDQTRTFLLTKKENHHSLVNLKLTR